MESAPDKVVLVGDVGVGKTSLFVRFKTGEFTDNVSHNPREGEYQKKWVVDGKNVSVSFQCIVVETSATTCSHIVCALLNVLVFATQL